MNVCIICSKEKEKIIECELLNGKVCLSCCFIIAGGRPEILKKLKNDYGLEKEVIIRCCSKCQPKIIKQLPAG